MPTVNAAKTGNDAYVLSYRTCLHEVGARFGQQSGPRVGDFGQVLAPYDGKYDRRRQGKLTKRETQHDGERSVRLSEGAVRNLNNDKHSAARKCRCVDHSRYLRHKPRAVDLDYQ